MLINRGRLQVIQSYLRGRVRTPAFCLFLIVTSYSAVMLFVTLMRFYTFRTYGDLAIFNQALYNTLHGRLFHETADRAKIPSGNLLGTHFAPVMFLLLPVYAVHPAPETLLVIQTIFVALGAIPVYLIGIEAVKN